MAKQDHILEQGCPHGPQKVFRDILFGLFLYILITIEEWFWDNLHITKHHDDDNDDDETK